MPDRFDIIVVGARCAGAPTAMLLARRGYRVLLVDRDRFPSDTISTHMIHPPGVALLRQWGLLERLAATGCPPITEYRFDFGAFTIAGHPAATDTGVATGFAPRRTILDKLLVDAAVEAGSELREAFVVDELLFDRGRVAGIRGHGRDGVSIATRARLVVGADGRHSIVARTVRPPEYREKPVLQCGYYSYWSNLPNDAFSIFVREFRAGALIPTHDGLTLIVVGWPYAEFDTNRKDPERSFLAAFDQAPELAARVRAARREEPLRGGMVSSYFRKPFGPGWVLVGDAGYNKDPVTAWGISDAFRDADRCTSALHAWLSGVQPFDEVMSACQQERDAHAMPMFELTCNFATLAPPPPPMQALLGAVSSQREAQDQFVSMMAGTLPVPAFFAPENTARILSAAGRAMPA
jgi:flavin-dependent dehydrogenase